MDTSLPTDVEPRRPIDVPPAGDYGIWSDHRIPEDRGDWHPLTRQFYEYWLAIAPSPGSLPGRQHIAPENMRPMLPHLWMLDVHRNPLRFRYRLVGTEIVRAMRREVTGSWLDEAHPQYLTNQTAQARYRMIAELARPTWRRGMGYWDRDPERREVENCLVPLAADGRTVDKIFALAISYDLRGKPLV